MTTKSNITNDFIGFLKNPNKQSFSGKWSYDILLFLSISLLSFVAMFVKHLVTKEPIVESTDFEMLKIDKIFMFVLLIPLFEEFAFRGFLVYKRKFYFVISVLTLIFMLLTYIENLYIKTSLIAVIILFAILVLLRKKTHKSLISFIQKNKNWLIYISSVTFGLMHLTNYDSFVLVNLMNIVIKILAGLFFCYTIIKYKNIWYSYLFHVLNNTFPLLIIAMSYYSKS